MLRRSLVMRVNWNVIFPSVTTQCRADQSLDLTATTAHLGRLMDAGVHGLILLGTVGENCSLEYLEKLEVIRASLKYVDGRVPLLTGVAECSTALACRFAADAEQLGVD